MPGETAVVVSCCFTASRGPWSGPDRLDSAAKSAMEIEHGSGLAESRQAIGSQGGAAL